jgi:hypothetical protein
VGSKAGLAAPVCECLLLPNVDTARASPKLVSLRPQNSQIQTGPRFVRAIIEFFDLRPFSRSFPSLVRTTLRKGRDALTCALPFGDDRGMGFDRRRWKLAA